MILTVLVVAQLQLSQPNGIRLDNSVARITEPAEIQPALGYRIFQDTTNPQVNVQSVYFYQPAFGGLQQTFDPQLQ